MQNTCQRKQATPRFFPRFVFLYIFGLYLVGLSKGTSLFFLVKKNNHLLIHIHRRSFYGKRVSATMQTKNIQVNPVPYFETLSKKGTSLFFLVKKNNHLSLYFLLPLPCFYLGAFLMTRNKGPRGVPIKMTWVIVGSNH